MRKNAKSKAKNVTVTLSKGDAKTLAFSLREELKSGRWEDGDNDHFRRVIAAIRNAKGGPK